VAGIGVRRIDLVDGDQCGVARSLGIAHSRDGYLILAL
jgi:hypothetical protein